MDRERSLNGLSPTPAGSYVAGTMSDAEPRILVADDQRDVLEALRLLLKGRGYEIETATSPPAVLRAVQARELDLVLLDLNYTRDTTSGKEGLDLLSVIQGLDPTLSVVVMTAWGSVDGAVEAMRRGARDYVEKPWDNDRLLATLHNQVELTRALRRVERLEVERESRAGDLPQLVAESRAMQPVLQLIERAGPSDANVLITGEPGTGKEVVARWLHARSPRAGRALVTLNAGAVAEGLFESELFGHVRGAFTDAKTDRVGYLELADRGTLFLDEIGTMPAAQQAKLLRALETGEFRRVGSSRILKTDVRVLAATNADLEAAVGAGDFREDLYYRLNTVEIQLPPLRRRPEDIPVLAALFLRREARRRDEPVAELTADAMEALRAHPWKGNVRELEHVIERAVLMAEGGRIDVAHLGLRPVGEGAPGLEGLTLEEAERILIQKALRRHRGNVSRAAGELGLSRSALYRRLDRYDLEP
jgi:DNA-binding NtrC family response regulator